MSFKETFWSPSGLWIVVREDPDRDQWIVRIYNFATWHHITRTFKVAQDAHNEADRWRV